MDTFKPKLLTVMRNYDLQQFKKDMTSGIIVAMIALPLSIAFALGSGVSAEKGIYSSILASILVALLGGSRVQITGPTGAFIVITQSIVAGYGTTGLMVAMILAGIILILMGVFRLGKLIKYIPSPITIGFTGGIAITIFTLEVRYFLGIPMEHMPTSFLGKWYTYLTNLDKINWNSFYLGLFTIAVLILWPKINKIIPNSLIAILLGTFIAHFLSLNVPALGDIPKTLVLPQLPALSIDLVFSLMQPAFTIAILVAMQALLSAVVTDELINGKHRANMELIAQGASNLVLGTLGCIPATGGVARSIANAKNGARTPMGAIFQSITLFLFLTVGMPFIKHVPMSVLAGILIFFSYHMFNVKAFLAYLRAPKSDSSVLLAACILTFAFDLILAIEVGMVLACILFMKRMADTSDIQIWNSLKDEEIEEESDPENVNLKQIPAGTLVFEISGPMFFGATDKFMYIFDSVNKNTKTVILQMRSAPAIDVTALNNLKAMYDKLKQQGITLLFCHVKQQPYTAMEKAGLTLLVGRENFYPTIDDALMRMN
ncbi:MAG: sulfate transporter [Lachnospiraceae bacterium]|jgi:SulP family sulfate permease|nr:sulfate transporter [Lachnospiraceae bacterium]